MERLKTKVDWVLDQHRGTNHMYDKYLPKQMSREEISLKLEELYCSGVTQIGDIMKAFSTLPADKKVVSELIKNRN